MRFNACRNWRKTTSFPELAFLFSTFFFFKLFVDRGRVETRKRDLEGSHEGIRRSALLLPHLRSAVRGPGPREDPPEGSLRGETLRVSRLFHQVQAEARHEPTHDQAPAGFFPRWQC